MNVCIVEGCNNKCTGNYCNKHKMQLKRYGEILQRTRRDKNEIIIKDNIAIVSLYNEDGDVYKHTLIDKEDIDKIKDYKVSFRNGYAYINYKGKHTGLHRIITNTINEVDKRHNLIKHINGDKLDNRKCNLIKVKLNNLLEYG